MQLLLSEAHEVKYDKSVDEEGIKDSKDDDENEDQNEEPCLNSLYEFCYF
jgi:hypothetical protein